MNSSTKSACLCHSYYSARLTALPFGGNIWRGAWSVHIIVREWIFLANSRQSRLRLLVSHYINSLSILFLELKRAHVLVFVPWDSSVTDGCWGFGPGWRLGPGIIMDPDKPGPICDHSFIMYYRCQKLLAAASRHAKIISKLKGPSGIKLWSLGHGDCWLSQTSNLSRDSCASLRYSESLLTAYTGVQR